MPFRRASVSPTAVQPSKRSRQPLALLVDTGLPTATATAVVATAYGSTAIASALSPTTATQATTAARIAAVAACEGPWATVDGRNDDADGPDPMLFVLVVSLPAGGTQFEREMTGALVTTTALLLAACLAVASLSRLHDAGTAAEPKGRKTARRVGVVLLTLVLGYHGPNVVNGATTLLAGAPSAAPARAVGVATAAAVLGATVGVFFPLWRRFDANLLEFPNGVPTHGEAFAAVQRSLAPLYDAGRELADPVTRLPTAEDLAVAHAIAVLTGLRPPTPNGCVGVAVATAVVALAHLAYLGKYRPYGVALEQGLAVVNGVVQLAVAVLSAAAVKSPAMTKPLGYTLVAADAMFFVQLLVLGIVGLRGDLARWRAATRPTPDTSLQQQQQPLLAVPGATAADADNAVSLVATAGPPAVACHPPIAVPAPAPAADASAPRPVNPLGASGTGDAASHPGGSLTRSPVPAPPTNPGLRREYGGASPATGGWRGASPAASQSKFPAVAGS